MVQFYIISINAGENVLHIFTQFHFMLNCLKLEDSENSARNGPNFMLWNTLRMYTGPEMIFQPSFSSTVSPCHI